MTDRRPHGAARTAGRAQDPPVPRDPPDQQVREGEDPLGVPLPPDLGTSGDRAFAPGDGHTEEDLPELDESGAGRSVPRQGGAHPEHPVPDEPTG
ncbi:hypothetical protein CP967_00660 [Streptomyces nitrosporeus]|uniref:Uncharacterized protein n=1 Tax=Streptomyces nitrosporeus TaxID=28894 RepID=A0A5J6F3R2_9ACTN|nr:hypothetical protein [Streptomyces nitrosporeus]QEU70667.1 hypothetical protein CP967_00660 [Streptomyces nitrosporeus]GGZ06135.1 hypothetical protein GCM10010327_40880 [Streptomyces nitrosporeus]